MKSSRIFEFPKRIASALLPLVLLSACATRTPSPVAPEPTSTSPVAVRLIAINDFHGNLKTPGAMRLPDPKDPSKQQLVMAGGAAHLSTAVQGLRQGAKHTIMIGAGDLVSASPLISSLFLDEPSIETLDTIGLDISSVGNHEFDRGRGELSRIIKGGCHKDGCITGKLYPGAKFKYLGANVIEEATGKSALPPYEIRNFGGVPIAFIGMTLRGTPAVVSRSGIVGLRFADEAETVNALVPELKKQGVEAIVVLIHEGGSIKSAWNDKSCPGFEGDILDVLKRLDKAVDLVVSGHTHKAYTCKIDGRWVTSAGDYGRFVTRIDLKLDPRTRKIIDIDPENTLVDPEKFPADPRVTRIIEEYEKLVAPRANRVVGYVSREVLAAQNTAGESTLGHVIADGQLLASQPAGAQIAFMNPGGIRAAINPRKPEGTVNYGDIFTVQPFGNNLVTMSLTGAQIVELLEGQFAREQGGWTRMLAVSKGFSYTWDNAAPWGKKIVPGSVKLNGVVLDPARKYRVTVNSFMADGGDGFQVLRQGTDREGGMLDLDAFEAWLKVNATQAAPYQPGPLNRVARLN